MKTIETMSRRRSTFAAFATVAAAAAAAAAVPATVRAQSSVQVFGVADLGVQIASQGGVKLRQLTSAGNNPTALGFRGVEDLGGGLYAGFWIEGSINMDTGSPASASTPYNRRSTVDLGGAWGTLRLGRDVVPSYWNLTLSDPFRTLGSGSNNNITGIGLSPAGVRSNNLFSYTYNVARNAHTAGAGSAGWVVHVAHAPGEQAGGVQVNQYTGARVAWQEGALRAGAAYGTTKGAGGNDFDNYNLMAAYTLGGTQLLGMAGVNDRDAAGSKNTFWSLGAQIRAGSGYVPVSLLSSRRDAAGSPRTRQLAAGYVYEMSKRTVLYTTLARIDNRSGSAVTFTGGNGGFATPALAKADADATGFDLGIRHSF